MDNEQEPQKSLAEQGIEAFEAGSKDEARRLLTQAVKEEPKNEKAWFYLAQLQTDPERTRQALRRVLLLDPEHLEAKAMLRRVEQEIADTATKAAENPSSSNGNANIADSLRDEPKVKRAIPASQVTGFGIRVPAGIPGAPERISLQNIFEFVQDKAQKAVGLLKSRGKEGVNTSEASWWQIVLMTLIIGLVTGLLSLILTMFSNFRILTIYGIITYPLITLFLTGVGLGSGLFLSHWFITTQRSIKANLLEHAYTLTFIWAVGSTLNLVINILEWILGSRVVTLREALQIGLGLSTSFGSVALTALAIAVAIGTAYFMVLQMKKLYPSASVNTLWITALIVLLTVGLLF